MSIGRAASPIRPGLIIRDYLLDHGSASISDIHRYYKQLVREENDRRARGKTIRPACYESFAKYFRCCRDLDLVELSGEEEPMSVDKELVYLRPGPGGFTVARSVKRYYKLTPTGQVSQLWENPKKR